MSELQNQSSLLEELDQRQDEVLAQLDQLNAEIEGLLGDFLRASKAEMEAAGL
jgi:hypothetical protein